MPPRIGWVIPVAVVAVAVFAGLDAIRSFGDEPTALAPSATEAVTTPQAHAVVALDSSRELRSGRVVELIPDHVSTDERFGFVATFRAPPGWYGYQDEGGFVIGNSLSAAVLGVNAPSGGVSVAGGVSVGYLDHPLARAVQQLEKAAGIRVCDVSSVRIGGYHGRKYCLVLHGPVSLQNVLGVAVDLRPGEEDVVLLGVDRKTLLIRRGFDSDQDRPEIERVITSLTFSDYPSGSAHYEIEQLGNRWARLFGAGQRCNRFMGQPLCERVDCMHAGGQLIPNCTPVSSEVQRSFAGAVLREVVVRGQQAAARFSNDETVRFTKAPTDQFWFIERVGAGGKLFE